MRSCELHRILNHGSELVSSILPRIPISVEDAIDATVAAQPEALPRDGVQRISMVRNLMGRFAHGSHTVQPVVGLGRRIFCDEVSQAVLTAPAQVQFLQSVEHLVVNLRRAAFVVEGPIALAAKEDVIVLFLLAYSAAHVLVQNYPLRHHLRARNSCFRADVAQLAEPDVGLVRFFFRHRWLYALHGQLPARAAKLSRAVLAEVLLKLVGDLVQHDRIGAVVVEILLTAVTDDHVATVLLRSPLAHRAAARLIHPILLVF
eukprot:scaffold1741_cov262-Pinguiococcus_pyrenoidosus.AAC.36